MRKTTLAAGAAIALAVVATSSVLAQTMPRPTPAARGDVDGDGRVSRAEFVDGRIARLTAVDANRDGSVSAEERQSGIDTRRNQRVSARFERLDKDGNGAISREEFAAPREPRAERAARPNMRGAHAGPAAGRERAGRMSPGRPRDASAPVSIAAVQTRVAAQFDRMDADRDGFVTAEERRTARSAMREQRRERRADRPMSPAAPSAE